jgi:hypothetical protein
MYRIFCMRLHDRCSVYMIVIFLNNIFLMRSTLEESMHDHMDTNAQGNSRDETATGSWLDRPLLSFPCSPHASNMLHNIVPFSIYILSLPYSLPSSKKLPGAHRLGLGSRPQYWLFTAIPLMLANIVSPIPRYESTTDRAVSSEIKAVCGLT